MRQALLPIIEAVFRILFEYDCLGEEHVPAHGPAVVVANHPSYLDPILLSLQVKRPIRFMAWEGLFKVPLLGAVMRAFGAFPVDTRPGQGRLAYEQAKALVLAGEVVGIFPEGKRSRTGWMEERLREGAARLAYETGAPLVPATIAGAYRAWPHFERAAAARPHPRTLPRADRPGALPRADRGGGHRGPPRGASAAGGAHPHARGEEGPARECPVREARALAAGLRGPACLRPRPAGVLENQVVEAGAARLRLHRVPARRPALPSLAASHQMDS